jgi:hypothetical protein
MNEIQLRQHVTILAWLHLAFAGLAILIGLFIFLLLGGIGLAIHDPEARPVLLVVGVAVGVFLFAAGVPGLIAGYGLLQRRTWSRVWAIIAGALHLFNIPIGTLLGIYTFWVLANPEAERYLQGGAGTA